MNCKACNTRIPSGKGQCPHCGHTERGSGGFIDRSPSSSGSQSGASSPGPLSPSTLGPDASEIEDDIHLDELDELDDEVELSLEDAMGSGAARSAKSGKPARSRAAAAGSGKGRAKPAAKSAKGTKAKASPSRGGKKKGARKEADAERTGAVGSAFVQLDAAQLRHLIAERPELLEAGLAVHVDAKGREVGARYDTEVGEIDLLARGADDEWVVVMIAAEGAGPELVPDALHRLGYVRKHVAEEGEAVRGIVLVDQLDEELGYAATAVADTVAFRTWRVALTFEPLDL